jgi:hypothetical protein
LGKVFGETVKSQLKFPKFVDIELINERLLSPKPNSECATTRLVVAKEGDNNVNSCHSNYLLVATVKKLAPPRGGVVDSLCFGGKLHLNRRLFLEKLRPFHGLSSNPCLPL